MIPREALYPPNDAMADLCAEIRSLVEEQHAPPGDLGAFILEWAHLEEELLNEARRLSERNVSVGEAIKTLARNGRISQKVASELHELRHFRNEAVHAPPS